MWGIFLVHRDVEAGGLSFEWSLLAVRKKHGMPQLNVFLSWSRAFCCPFLLAWETAILCCCSWFRFLGVGCLSRVARGDFANRRGQVGQAHTDGTTWPVLSLQARESTTSNVCTTLMQIPWVLLLVCTIAYMCVTVCNRMIFVMSYFLDWDVMG